MRYVCALLLLVLVAGCQSAPARVQPVTAAAGSTEPGLNPHVLPPPGRVQAAPDLPTITAPPGMISQQEAMARALEWESKNGARLTLSQVKFDTLNNMWEVDFTVDDANIAVSPRSHPAEFTSNDPVEQRKQRRSWFCLAKEFHIFLNGRTGESKGGGFACGEPDRSRTDLEHYRGVMVDGGETTILRLLNPDGNPEGRDLRVAIPQSVLDADHLALWQIEYGVNRTLEVWGLTGPQQQVVAYRIDLSAPPPERLPNWRLVAGVPVYPGAFDRPDHPDRRLLLAKGADVASVMNWYDEQMPTYGWKHLAVSQGPGQAIQFRGAGGVVVQLSITPVSAGTEIALTWVSGKWQVTP